MNQYNIIEFFIKKLGTPDCSASLEYYINLVYSTYENTAYGEMHHILPKSKFKEFINEEWNIVFLPYDVHCKAHEFLAKAYPIRSFLKPLNFMKFDLTPEEYNVLRSKAALNGWKSFKNDEEKYNVYLKRRSEISKELWKSGVYEDVIELKHHSEETKQKIKDSLKKYWVAGENNSHKLKLSESKKTDEYRKKQSLILKNKWEAGKMDSAKKALDEHRKIATINAAEKNKEYWKNEGFRKKMKLARSGIYWWNNGIENKKSKTCPGDGWVRGRIMDHKPHLGKFK